MAETTSSITTSEGQASRVINQLAAVVRKIGWSYAILWSLSSKYPGALTWGGGFYNGETKPGINNTRDLGHEALKFYRSKQLEKLYDILVTGESVNQSVTSLSPEDLRDGEWYYLISMSYVFRSGQGLPGRCFAGNEYVWMCNGHAADSKTFHRALLAKSSSIQVDKASILAETISHIRELKQRLQELECTDQIFLPNRKETETAMPCGAELTTPSNTDKVRTKMSRKKRKAPEMTGGDDRSPGEVNITVVDKAVQIEVLCPWKEVVITQVFHAITRLNLEVVQFQASKSNALLRMKIKAQPTSSSIVAPGLIGEALLSAIAG